MKLSKHQNIRAFIVLVAVVMIWRGAWGILDKYLFPENPALSFIISLIAGLILLTLIHFKLKNLK